MRSRPPAALAQRSTGLSKAKATEARKSGASKKALDAITPPQSLIDKISAGAFTAATPLSEKLTSTPWQESWSAFSPVGSFSDSTRTRDPDRSWLNRTCARSAGGSQSQSSQASPVSNTADILLKDKSRPPAE